MMLCSCHAQGYAGSDAKVDYMKSLGFDAAYNYKTMSSLKDTLKESCPAGVDMFFDNVSSKKLKKMQFALESNEIGENAGQNSAD